MKRNTKKYIFIGIAILIAAGFDLYQYKDSAYAYMDKWKLIPREERFTELYFNDPANLPKKILNGEKISFSFVIHNLEGESRKYSYIVYFKSQDNQTVKIEKNIVILAAGETKNIEESYTSTLAENKGKIFVELENYPQKIDFLLSSNE